MPETTPFATGDRLFRITDDLFGLRLPMPPPLEWVNVYFLRDGDGWAMVDTGYNTPDSRGVLMEALDQHLDNKPITRVFVTHYHPDHVGQAGYICGRYNCPLYMTQTDWLLARWLSTDNTSSYLKTIADYYRSAGTPAEMFNTLTERGNSFLRTSDEVPPSFTVLRDSDRITIGKQSWQIIVGKGHAPEMYTMYDADNKFLISADHIVARITPNISIWPYSPNDNPLKDYLESMAHFATTLPDDITLLPGHGRSFSGFHERINSYRVHHEGRLDKLMAGLQQDGAKTLHQLLEVLFPRVMSPRDYVFALGEAHSHINYLVHAGKVRKDTSKPVFQYQVI
jgi:glyoxylase-like metal-dependent hydrolase (beta-lactamase superfamily II)